MGLPSSRDVNYSPGATPVSGVNLNNIQDTIIGQKFRSTPLYISGSEFVVDGGNSTRAGHVWTFASASTQRIALGLRLIPGTRITDIIWSYNRTSSTLLFELNRRSFGDGGVTSGTPSSLTISTGTGWTTVAASSVAGMPLVTTDGFYYQLALTSTSAALFDGVKLLIDRL